MRSRRTAVVAPSLVPPSALQGITGSDPVPNGPDRHPDVRETASGRAAGSLADHELECHAHYCRQPRISWAREFAFSEPEKFWLDNAAQYSKKPRAPLLNPWSVIVSRS